MRNSSPEMMQRISSILFSRTNTFMKAWTVTGNFHLNNMNIMASTYLVFVYGTLKSGEPNHDVIANSNGHYRFIGKAQTTKRWPLVIASRYNIPFLLFAEEKGHKVTGELYEVDDSLLQRIDELECHPKYYERQEETVCLLGCADESCVETEKILTAWIYFLKDYKPHMLELPFLEEYSSSGPHGLEYVSRYNRTGEPYILEVKLSCTI